MDFSGKDYLSIDALLGSVVRLVDDVETKKLPIGRYRSFAQRALQEFSFHTFFNKQRMDFVVPQNLRIELPAGTFSIAEVYAYNGTECDIRVATKLWYKENYFTRGNGFFAKNRGDNVIDPYYPSQGSLVRDRDSLNLIRKEGSIDKGLMFYSVENGVLMVSSAALNFEKLHVVAHGSICPIGEVPMIPPLFQEAIEDYVCESACRELMPRFPQVYSGLWQIYNGRLNQRGMNGSWHNATRRVRDMSKGQRNDWGEYFSRWSW